MVSIFKLVEGEEARNYAEASPLAAAAPAASAMAKPVSRSLVKTAAKKPAAAPAAPKPKKVVSSAGNDDWEEF